MDVPTFRKPAKARNIKLRTVPSAQEGDKESESEQDVESQLNDIREAQKGRLRQHGMTAVECAVGKELAKEFNQLDEDPFRMKGGGMLRLSDDRKAALAAADIENDIKEQFKKETLLRDENEEMRKYIDLKLKRKEVVPSNVENSILLRAAGKMKGYTSSKSNEELLSNQMLVGIPEVDLGIDVRISNIIDTEKKKMELFRKKQAKEGNEGTIK
ncbi:hepatocellular carcinoma-associated antigen 59 domain-containing protein [Ditylenchus destructor]|uniref:Hepatocellular carcinoma-associated antigen 59 domain-containing protein n=1 Tax=Ditylenchus destructor TaxID=166010 RepID=A0AAD4N6Y9_9BILA|nr:hepatocellular carcinoma-associated antigen 59 domain-containing protein [Ditylenchus destructor]